TAPPPPSPLFPYTTLFRSLSLAIERADRMRSRLALLILDLNGFKIINDTMGHQAGDQVLREVSGHLRKSVRASDTLARLGGDERSEEHTSELQSLAYLVCR